MLTFAINNDKLISCKEAFWDMHRHTCMWQNGGDRRHVQIRSECMLRARYCPTVCPGLVNFSLAIHSRVFKVGLNEHIYFSFFQQLGLWGFLGLTQAHTWQTPSEPTKKTRRCSYTLRFFCLAGREDCEVPTLKRKSTIEREELGGEKVTFTG